MKKLLLLSIICFLFLSIKMNSNNKTGNNSDDFCPFYKGVLVKKADSIRTADSIAAVEAAAAAEAALTANIELPAVCGITFGESYKTVEQQLERRYGEKSPYSDHNTIEYYDFTIGGYIFEVAHFYFQYDEYGHSYFNYAVFSIHYDLSENGKNNAILTRDGLVKTISKKYDNMISKVDDNGFKYYLCGQHPSENQYLISISIKKDQSKGGNYYYYLNLDYGPIDFINSLDDF